MGETVAVERQGTMQVTAQEGIAFLKDSRHDTLLQVQGLVAPAASSSAVDKDDSPPPPLPKQGTMVTTAKEGGEILDALGDGKPSEDAKTRGQDQEIKSTKPKKPATPRSSKQHSVNATVSEGEALLAKMGAPKSRTRGAKVSYAPQPPAKKAKTAPKMARTGTMQATAKEGEAILDGETIGASRAETAEQGEKAVGKKRGRKPGKGKKKGSK